jgi:hypothetical protein
VVRLGSEDWVPVRKRFCLGFYFWLGPWLDGVSMRPLDEMDLVVDKEMGSGAGSGRLSGVWVFWQ